MKPYTIAVLLIGAAVAIFATPLLGAWFVAAIGGRIFLWLIGG